MATFFSNIERFAFQNFDAVANATPYHLYNFNAFATATFRVSLDVAATISFHMSLDKVFFVDTKIFHIEANDYVQSVPAFTSGHFVAAIAGMSMFQITTTGGAKMTISGRQTRDGLGSLGFTGLTHTTDGIVVITPLDGSTEGVGGAVQFVRRDRDSFATAYTETWAGIVATDNSVVPKVTVGDEDVSYSFRNASDDLIDYVHPEMRPVLKIKANGVAPTSGGGFSVEPISFGFRVDISAIDFTDVIGIGFEVYCESDFDYKMHTGERNPDTVQRNYKRFKISIRDSSAVILWEAQNIDCSFGLWDIVTVQQYRVDFDGTTAPLVGGWADVSVPAPIRLDRVTVDNAAWLVDGDDPQTRGMMGNPAKNNTQYRKFEFCLERENAHDTENAFYLHPRNYPMEGEPNLPATTSGAVAWDLSTATHIYIVTEIGANDGTDLAVDVSGMSLGGTAGTETQIMYFKNLFVRKRPYDYKTHHPLGYAAV